MPGKIRQARQCHAHLRHDPTVQCKKAALEGQFVCGSHGGNNPRAKEKALARLEIEKIVNRGDWKLEGHPIVDPGETLLLLISAWKVRGVAVSNAIQAMVDKAGGDLEKALTAETWVETDGKMVKVGEHLKGLVELDFRITAQVASWSSTAIKAGLEDRRVRLQERNANDFVNMTRSLLNDPEIGLTAAQRQAFTRVLGRVVERKQLVS
jgi:hypothetical protein